MLKALKKRRDDAVLEIVAGKGGYDLLADLFRNPFEILAHHVITNPGVEQGDFGFFVFGDAEGGMQRDRIPH
ncbi:hypothetical protein D3C76_1387800 [compost metagenome]